MNYFIVILLIFIQQCVSIEDEEKEKIDQQLIYGNALMMLEMKSAILATVAVENSNLLFSPLTLISAMASCLLVTTGNKHQEIARALSIGQIDSKHPEIVNELLAKHIDGTLQVTPSSDASIIKFSSLLLWRPDKGVAHSQAWFVHPDNHKYTSVIKELHELNKIDKDVIRNDINNWARQKRQYYKFALQGNKYIHTEPHAFIYSYLNFNARFAVPFTSIGKDIFYNILGKPLNVEMISGEGEFAYYNDVNLGLSVVGIPYKELDLTLYVIKPNEGNNINIIELENHVTSTDLLTLIKHAKKRPILVNVMLPKVKIQNTLHLSNAFRALGMYDLFFNELNTILRKIKEGDNSTNNNIDSDVSRDPEVVLTRKREVHHFTKRNEPTHLPQIKEEVVSRVLHFISHLKDVLRDTHDLLGGDITWQNPTNLVNIEKILTTFLKSGKEANLVVKSNDEPKVPIDAESIEKLTDFIKALDIAFNPEEFIIDDLANVKDLVHKVYTTEEVNVQPGKWSTLINIVKKAPAFLQGVNKAVTEIQKLTSEDNIKTLHKLLNTGEVTDNSESRKKRTPKRNHGGLILRSSDIEELQRFLVESAHVLKTHKDLQSDIAVTPSKLPPKNALTKLQTLFNYIKRGAQMANLLTSATGFTDDIGLALSTNELSSIDDINTLPTLSREKIKRIIMFVENMKRTMKETHMIVDSENDWQTPDNLLKIEELLKLFYDAAKEADLLTTSDEKTEVDNISWRKLWKFVHSLENAFKTHDLSESDLSQVEKLSNKIQEHSELEVQPGKWSSMVNVVKKIPKFLGYVNEVVTQVKTLTSDENIQAVHNIMNAHKKHLKTDKPEPEAQDIEEYQERRRREGSELHEFEPILYASDIKHVEKFLFRVINTLENNPSIHSAIAAVDPLSFDDLLKYRKLFHYIKNGANIANMLYPDEHSKHVSGHTNADLYDHKMFRKENIYFSEVIHNMKMSIMESVSEESEKIEPTSSVSFACNRPFFFVVKNEVTDFYLLYGIVTNPLD